MIYYTLDGSAPDETSSDFYISKYEVTLAEYQAVMGTNPAHNYGVGKGFVLAN